MDGKPNPFYSENPDQRAMEEVEDWMRNLIGQCVIVYSHLEEGTDLMLNVLTMHHGMSERASGILSENLPMRTKCAVISLAFELKLDNAALEKLTELTSKISHDLRN